MAEKIAIVPGSFDPITLGHADIALRAAALYDRVLFAVMVNDSKRYLFTLEQRKKIAAAAFEGQEKIEVISSDGMLWRLARDTGACAIVKGYRDARDYQYELEMAKFNAEHFPGAKTVLLEADAKFRNISSTAVRERLRNNLDLEGYVPAKSIEQIYKIITTKL